MGHATGANSSCNEPDGGEPLLILGASARAAAMSARRAGFNPWAADLFADQDLQAICPTIRVEGYPHGLWAAFEFAPSGPWMYTGALENHPDLIDRLAAIRPLYGISGESLRAVRNPERLSAVLRAAGFDSPHCSLVPDGIPTDGSWLVKPLASAGGSRISPWRGRSDGFEPPCAGAACSRYFQERIDGLPASAVYVGTDGSALLLGITRQLVGLPWCAAGTGTSDEFRYCGSIGPLELTATHAEQLEKLGPTLAASFDLRGLLGVDVILSGDEVWPIEVNPRYTASTEILERIFAVNAIRLHVSAFDDDLPHPVSALPASSAFKLKRGDRGDLRAGKAILYAPSDLKITDEFVAWTGLQNLGHIWPSVADIPAPGTAIRRGQPIVTILAEARTDAPVLASLKKLAAEAYEQLAVSPEFANNLPAGMSENSCGHSRQPMVE
jgi:predicted ATP-grasp superfamily ATP-dependent carboligase